MQNATLILMMRYSRTRPGDLYITSTAVMLTEIVKVVLSALMLLVEEQSIIGWLKYLYANTIGQPLDMLKMAVPACIYTIQNNLLYIALSNLDAATYQVNIRSAALGSRKWGMGWGGISFASSSRFPLPPPFLLTLTLTPPGRHLLIGLLTLIYLN